MTSGYPTAFSEIAHWATANGFPQIEGRTRFAQFAILRAITQIDAFQRSLVFKGGNALDFVWLSNRSTLDLDFSIDSNAPAFIPSVESIGDLLRSELEADDQVSKILFRVNRVRQQPPGPGRTFVTFQTRIGYALPDETALRKRMTDGHPSPHMIPVEISTNERVCESRDIELRSSSEPLRVSAPEDIVAEKLRALLQQPIRNRTRRQDLLDIAVILRSDLNLDRAKTSSYLLAKSAGRDVPVSRAAFHNPQIGIRAHDGYEGLAGSARRTFISFEEALAILLAFTDQLDIPEN